MMFGSQCEWTNVVKIWYIKNATMFIQSPANMDAVVVRKHVHRMHAFAQ